MGKQLKRWKQIFCIFSWESRYEWENKKKRKNQFPDNFVDMQRIVVVVNLLDSYDYTDDDEDDDAGKNDEEQKRKLNSFRLWK